MFTSDGKLALDVLLTPLVGPGAGPLGGPGAGPPPRDHSFGGNGGAGAGARAPHVGLRMPERTRPVAPGFGDTRTAPSGSTVRAELPTKRFTQAQLREDVQPAKSDGFDECVSSIVAEALPAPPVRLRRPAQPAQRLMGVADVLGVARATPGGPRSAVPPKTTAESDFYVMRPTRKRPGPEQAAPRQPRAKLAAWVFILVVLAVLAGVAVAFFYLH